MSERMNYFDKEWLERNGDDEPERRLPSPCGNCGHFKVEHDDATHCCDICFCKGWIPYIERDLDDALHRIFAEHDRNEAKW